MPYKANRTSFKKGHPFIKGGERRWFKKGHKSWLKGTKGLVKANKGSFKKGNRIGNQYAKGNPPNSTSFKIGQFAKEKHPFWKGGISFLKLEALNRDNGACQCNSDCNWHNGRFCGFFDKEIMEVDHINPRSMFPKEKYKLENLITLCPNCHRKKTNLFLKKHFTNKKYAKKYHAL